MIVSTAQMCNYHALNNRQTERILQAIGRNWLRVKISSPIVEVFLLIVAVFASARYNVKPKNRPTTGGGPERGAEGA